VDSRYSHLNNHDSLSAGQVYPRTVVDIIESQMAANGGGTIDRAAILKLLA